MYERDYLHNKSTSENNDVMFKQYQKLRNDINYQIKVKKEKFFNEAAKDTKNTKTIWNSLKLVLGNRKAAASPPPELTPNRFNNYFTEIGGKLFKSFINDIATSPWKESKVSL